MRDSEISRLRMCSTHPSEADVRESGSRCVTSGCRGKLVRFEAGSPNDCAAKKTSFYARKLRLGCWHADKHIIRCQTNRPYGSLASAPYKRAQGNGTSDGTYLFRTKADYAHRMTTCTNTEMSLVGIIAEDIAPE